MLSDIKNYETKLQQNPWVVCLTCSLFFLYEFIQMNMFNSISPELIKTFHINASELGNFSAMYLYATTIFVFFVGASLDKFSVRKLVLTAMASCIIFTALFAISSTLEMAEIFRFLSGISGAYCFLSCMVLASRWVPSTQLALAAGLIVTMAMIGGTFAQTPLTFIVSHIGWRNAMLLDCALGVVFFVAMYFIVSDYPKLYNKKETVRTTNNNSMGKNIMLAISSKQNWIAGSYTSLMNLMVLSIGATWGNAYLETVHHISRTDASFATMMIYIGTIIGSPLVGWYSDRIKSRKQPMVYGAVISLALSAFIIYSSGLSATTIIIIFFLLGLITSTQIISYPLIFESNAKNITGSSESLASVLILGGGAVCQYLYGILLDSTWSGGILEGTRLYSTSNHIYAFNMIPIAFIISIVLALMIKETSCKHINDA
jgi:predicted MFS family arabinose efflux permease